MAEPKNIKLYNSVKKLADKKFESKTGIYKSSWIVREYKKRGGTYKGSKPKNSGLKRWYKEGWIDLNRPIKNSRGKVVGYKPCGRTSSSTLKYPLCRPSTVISSKTPRTYKELSKKRIQKAKKDKSKIKSHGNIKFGGSPQYHGKKSSVMVSVPSQVKQTALYAFKLRKLGFQGGLETGWKRAKQLGTKDSISIQDIKYMRAWFTRHIITSYPSYKEWKEAGRPKTKEWHTKRGIIAWLIWGGSAAFRWINSERMTSKLNRYFGKEYKSIAKII